MLLAVASEGFIQNVGVFYGKKHEALDRLFFSTTDVDWGVYDASWINEGANHAKDSHILTNFLT